MSVYQGDQWTIMGVFSKCGTILLIVMSHYCKCLNIIHCCYETLLSDARKLYFKEDTQIQD